MPVSVLALPFIDSAGDTHPSAIWLPGTVVMDNLDKTGGVDWVAYHSPAALAAGDTPIQGGQHHTALDGTLYAGVVSFPVQAGTYGAATAIALTYLAKNVKDTPGKNADGTPQLDPVTGQPVLVSYFAAATVVTLG